MPLSGHGCQVKSVGLSSWPRGIVVFTTSTDLDGVGGAIGAASTGARCELSQTRAIIVVPPARTRATINRSRVRARMAVSPEVGEEDDEHCGGSDRDPVRNRRR